MTTITDNPNFSMLDTGCILDCSHLSTVDLDRRIIGLAEMGGFKSEPFIVSTNHVPFDLDLEFEDHVTFTATEALEYLNEVADEHGFFEIRDNSLFYITAEDLEAEQAAGEWW